MKRINPLGSLVGLGLTILLFVGLGISLVYNRGLAFSPGDVTAKLKNGVILKGFSSHAAFEKQCGNCHEPIFSSIAAKCTDCHVDVNQEIRTSSGVHSRVSNVSQCADCHPEHRGRSFDPTAASFSLFDHSNTRFSLKWHQTDYDTSPISCNQCHKNPDFSIVDNQTCQDCHSSHDANSAATHALDFGSNCLGCHDGVDRMRNFDHQSTGYELIGAHRQTACTACHTNADFQDTPTACNDCHIEPSMHISLSDQICDSCHTPQAWKPAQMDGQSFEHYSNTAFSLALHQVDYFNQTITCTTCHPDNLQTTTIQTCIDCHSQHDQVFMNDHQQQYSSSCLECHDGVDRLSNFAHNNFFPLDGKHTDLQCADCHADQVYRGTPTECSQCHREPEIHASVFGLQCVDCHTTDAWSPASLLVHKFPLNHGLEDSSAQLECAFCHGTTYIDYTCYNCHEHQQDEMIRKHQEAGILEQDIPVCAKCHPDGTVVEVESP